MSKVKSQWDGSAAKDDCRKDWCPKDDLNSIPVSHNGRIGSILPILWPQNTHIVKYRGLCACAHTCRSTHAHNKWRFGYKLSNVKLMNCVLIKSTKSPFEEISLLFVQKIYLWLRNSSWDGEILVLSAASLEKPKLGISFWCDLVLQSTVGRIWRHSALSYLGVWECAEVRGQRCSLTSVQFTAWTHHPLQIYPVRSIHSAEMDEWINNK